MENFVIAVAMKATVSTIAIGVVASVLLCADQVAVEGKSIEDSLINTYIARRCLPCY